MDRDTELHIINVLRRGTTTWKGRTECINRGRYLALNPETGNQVWHRDCDRCGRPTMIKDGLLEVDHIKQIGSFLGDWHKFVLDMYCGQDNLQALCLACHERKTTTENAKMRFQRKRAEDSL